MERLNINRENFLMYKSGTPEYQLRELIEDMWTDDDPSGNEYLYTARVRPDCQMDIEKIGLENWKVKVVVKESLGNCDSETYLKSLFLNHGTSFDELYEMFENLPWHLASKMLEGKVEIKIATKFQRTNNV